MTQAPEHHPGGPSSSPPLVSLIALIAANSVPLFGVVFLGWQIFPLIFLYWVENLIIGGLNIVRMLAAQPQSRGLWTAKIFLVPFFTFHFGMFTAVHGVFVLTLFGGSSPHSFPPFNAIGPVIREWGLSRAVLALLASHIVSLVFNYLGRGEYKTAAPEQLMFAPYGRVVVLHLTLLFGGLLMLNLDSPLVGLVLFVVVKTVFDAAAHVREHGRAQGRTPFRPKRIKG